MPMVGGAPSPKHAPSSPSSPSSPAGAPHKLAAKKNTSTSFNANEANLVLSERWYAATKRISNGEVVEYHQNNQQTTRSSKSWNNNSNSYSISGNKNGNEGTLGRGVWGRDNSSKLALQASCLDFIAEVTAVVRASRSRRD